MTGTHIRTRHVHACSCLLIQDFLRWEPTMLQTTPPSRKNLVGVICPAGRLRVNSNTHIANISHTGFAVNLSIQRVSWRFAAAQLPRLNFKF